MPGFGGEKTSRLVQQSFFFPFAVCHQGVKEIFVMSQSASSFKNIDPVPNGIDFLDIVLSRTQRRLPTVIRPGFKISRIRAFYARKVKYTQESFTEKLDAILTQFPRLDSIHPFHADLVFSQHDEQLIVVQYPL